MNMDQQQKSIPVAIKVGVKFGLAVLTCHMTIKLGILGLETLQSRSGNPGGEILIVPLMILLVWIGWTARGEISEFKKRMEMEEDDIGESESD